jgi:hypothetical protein
MNLQEAKTLIELMYPGIKEIVQAATDNVSRAVGDALAESNRKTNAQLAEIIARIERLENRE